MNPQLRVLANKLGVKLSDRVAMDIDHGVPDGFQWSQALYDGKTIACMVQRWKYEEDEDGSNPQYIMGPIQGRYDHDILHEIAHWFVASETQRELHEFGMGTVAYGEPLGERFEWEKRGVPIPAVVDSTESETQEYMSWLLCVKWGKEFGISPELSELKSKDWDHYLVIKIGHAQHETGIPNMWEALSRLHQQGIIP